MGPTLRHRFVEVDQILHVESDPFFRTARRRSAHSICSFANRCSDGFADGEQHSESHAPAEEGWRQSLGDAGSRMTWMPRAQCLPTCRCRRWSAEVLCTKVPPPVADLAPASNVQVPMIATTIPVLPAVAWLPGAKVKRWIKASPTWYSNAALIVARRTMLPAVTLEAGLLWTAAVAESGLTGFCVEQPVKASPATIRTRTDFK